MDYEYRALKEQPAIAGNKVVGYAAVFNSFSGDLGGFTEIIRPGAFSAVLKNNPDVRALIDHEDSRLLGRTGSGTLTLSEDNKGLRYEVNLPNTDYANNLRVLMDRGDVDKSSFAFTVNTAGQKWTNQNGKTIREITNVSSLRDVSVITSVPAYSETSVALRSLTAFQNEMAIEIDRMKRIKQRQIESEL